MKRMHPLAAIRAAFACICLFVSRAALPDDALRFDPTPGDRLAAGEIRDDVLRAHTRFLADDLLEGRGPGSRGDLISQRYIASRFEALGLRPAAPEGGWHQRVPLLGVTTRVPAVLSLAKGERSLDLRFRDDFIAASGTGARDAALRDAEVVFVGYGITAPEYSWDDFKGADVRGKVLLVMNNDPSSDPRLFAGTTRLYYGRWDYKYEHAARRGAAGAIIIHTTESAGYPWQVVQTSWTGEQFELKEGESPRLAMRAWVTEESARKLASLGGADLQALRQAAESRDFRPVSLGVRVSASLPADIRDVESANVLGHLEGSDPERRAEMVVVTAHHDHLGMETDAAATGRDRIYNGAVDNASGVAALLAIASAYIRVEPRPSRSILFAAVAAEEQGLLGSEYLAAHPPAPPGRLAATINIDGVNIFGRTRDISVIGRGKSTLDRFIEAVAAWQGRIVKPDQFPDRGFFYRSDQFSLAKIGVPGVYIDSGTDYIGRPAGWGKEKLEEWERTHYHQPSDELRDEWDLSGAVEDIQLLFHVGLLAARAPDMPAWTPGDEFEAARKEAVKALR